MRRVERKRQSLHGNLVKFRLIKFACIFFLFFFIYLYRWFIALCALVFCQFGPHAAIGLDEYLWASP